MIERRRHPRQRVLKRGLLTFNGGGGIDCTVRNMSVSGARVDVASPIGVPNQFHLVIEADGFIRRGRPVWSSERQIGIAFDQ
ncbi:MAG: pilus assembly protein PilZ [Bradyrhizobiaceae bacterium PARB1]|jgi:PilZ domain|nr:MAG: pilus assembly protein PilZ [Bradyrhizobiaceae bacterium PARB1]